MYIDKRTVMFRKPDNKHSEILEVEFSFRIDSPPEVEVSAIEMGACVEAAVAAFKAKWKGEEYVVERRIQGS